MSKLPIDWANGVDVLSYVEDIHDFKALDLSDLLLNHEIGCECRHGKLNSNVGSENHGKFGPKEI